MIDRAYWSPQLIKAAHQVGADMILGYAFDQYLSDVNGYCGGWTPQAAAEIRSAGLRFAPIFTFRGGQTLTPARCVQLVQQLGCQRGDWVVASDTETGAMPEVSEVTAIVQALKAAGYRVLVYGNAQTLKSGYLADVDAPWVAEYPGGAVLPAPLLANMPNVGEWTYAAWQYCGSATVADVQLDLSVHNLPWEAPDPPAPKPTPAPEPPPPPPAWAGESDMPNIVPISYNNNPQTFSIDNLGRLVHRYWTGSKWAEDYPIDSGCLAGGVPGVLLGAQGDPDRIDVFCPGATGDQLHIYWAKAANGYEWQSDDEA